MSSDCANSPTLGFAGRPTLASAGRAVLSSVLLPMVKGCTAPVASIVMINSLCISVFAGPTALASNQIDGSFPAMEPDPAWRKNSAKRDKCLLRMFKAPGLVKLSAKTSNFLL